MGSNDGVGRMHVLSVNVSLPRPVGYRGRTVMTGIFKPPVTGRVRVRTLGLEGDGQADLSVHGGPTKAIYLYPSEHYPYWQKELGRSELPPGMFGENLTTQGLLEADVRIGDRFRVGSAIVEVTQPRGPCYKLGIRFGRMDIVRKFYEAGRTGFYLAVVKEGEVAAGDAIERISSESDQPTVKELVTADGAEG